MVPSLVGSKRLREDFEDDLAQIRDTILQALSRQENPDAGLHESVAAFSKSTQDVLSQNPTELVHYLRVTLQHLISTAHKRQEPLLTYTLSKKSQPAVQTLLKVAAGLSHSGALPAGEVFGLILDVVETNRAEDVKACLNYMGTLWDSWNTLPASFARSPTRLAFQKVYNMFCQRISNNQDAEVLGAVATVVAKLMPFNDPAGLNTPFNCNQHHIPMDESIGASVDGSDPVDLPFYKQLWELQLLFQRPHDQTEPEQWPKTVSGIQQVLDTLKGTPIGVASRTTAVPQDGGKSVIVKYLTSSKLTRLQLRDAAFRRTLLLQCLVLLHACAHPILRKPKPGGAVGQKLPVPVLKEKQLAELNHVENQLYEELSKTPKQGAAFADVIRTVLDRETAFLKWKLDGAEATVFWNKAAAALKELVQHGDVAVIEQQDIFTGLVSAMLSSLHLRWQTCVLLLQLAHMQVDRALPQAPARDLPEELDHRAPDTALDLSRMWENAGAQEDLYRSNRDDRMLPTTEEHLAQVGREISGNVLMGKQYANTKAPGGVDPLFLFRAQRMLQRKDIYLFAATTQIVMSGERLEIAFDNLYPGQVGPNWTRPVLPKDPKDEQLQGQGFKRVSGKVTPGRAVSGAMEDELAGVKPSADASVAPAQPLGEDTVQTAPDHEAAGADTQTGRQVVDASMGGKKPQEGQKVTEPGKAADQGMSEADDAALGVASTGDQPAKLDSAATDAVPSLDVAAAEPAGTLPVQATSEPEAGIEKQQPAVSATADEAIADQSLTTGAQSGAVVEAAKSETISGVAETKAQGGAASKDAALGESHAQQDIAVPMDQDRT